MMKEEIRSIKNDKCNIRRMIDINSTGANVHEMKRFFALIYNGIDVLKYAIKNKDEQKITEYNAKIVQEYFELKQKLKNG